MAIDNKNDFSSSGYSSSPADKNATDFNQTSSYGSSTNYNTQSSNTNQSSPVQGVPDAITQVVDQIFAALQPRVHQYVSDFANRMVGVSDQSARQLVSRARQNPIYTIGAIALLVVGLGLILGNDRSGRLSPHELH